MAFFNTPTPGSAMASQVQGPPPVQVAPTDVIGPIMKKWETEAQNQMLKAQAQRALMGSAFGLAGSGLGAWGLNGFPLTGTKIGKLFGMTDPAVTNKLPNGVGSHLNYSMGGSSDPASLLGPSGSDLSLLDGGGQVTDLGSGIAGGAPASGMTGLAGMEGLGLDMSMLGSGAVGSAAADAALGAGVAEVGTGLTAEEILPLLLALA